MLWKL